jgi:hypothetical protein
MIEQGRLFKECAHEQTTVIRYPPSSPHYAKELCSKCRKFLRWIPKPETIQRQIQNTNTLGMLVLRIDDLDEWTRHFIRSVSGLKHLSPKQQQVLDDLRHKYLGATTK